MLIPLLARFTSFTLGAAFAMPLVVDALGAWSGFASYATHRDIWQMTGAGVFIVLFSVGCKHAEDVLPRLQKVCCSLYTWLRHHSPGHPELFLAKDKS